MSNLFNYENLLKSIIELQSHLYHKPLDKLKPIKDNYVNAFSNNENAIKLVFDHEHFKIAYISDNVEALTGYSTEDFYKLNFVLKIITFNHIAFIYDWLNWAVSIHAKLGDLFNTKQMICGVKLKHKDGHIMSVMLRYSALEMAESGGVKIAVISIDDITHLIKSEFYWGRLERHNDSEINIHHFLSTDKKDAPHDIISDREKAVLRLLAEGKESKAIGELLHISHHTIDNHRRNMITRIGVKDTTGLIQISKMAGII
jgi:DNA-binding CsgD family transcriptional regulator